MNRQLQSSSWAGATTCTPCPVDEVSYLAPNTARESCGPSENGQSRRPHFPGAGAGGTTLR
eukprot:8253504-Alexandrium_andersonii.AAC.1